MDETRETGGPVATSGAPAPGGPPVRVAVTALRDDLAEWVNRVAYGGETLLVHRRGRPLALVVPYRAQQEPGAADGAGGSTVPPPLAGSEETAGEAAAGPGPDPGEDRERDREDLRAIFGAIAASAGEEPRPWRPVRPGGPRVRLLAAVDRALRELEGPDRAGLARLLDLLAAGSLEGTDLPGTGGRVLRFEPAPGGPAILWRREADGALTVLAARPGRPGEEGTAPDLP